MSKPKVIGSWLKDVHATMLKTVESISPEKWRQQPLSGGWPRRRRGWSAAEVIVHLCQAEAATQKGMKRVFAAEPRPVPLWKRLHIPPVISRWRIGRFQTSIPLDLSLLDEKEKMLASFHALREATLKILADDRDLSRWRFPHPIFGYLDGYTWFKSIGYHEIRHTKQLREIVNGLQ